MPMPEIQKHSEAVEVTYRLGDFMAVLLQRWRYWVSLTFVIAGLVIGIPVMLDVLDGRGLSDAFSGFDWRPLAVLILFVIALVTASTAFGFWWGKRQGRLVPTRFLVTEEGVNIENSFAESFLFWSTLKRVAATKERLFLFIGPHTAFILPRRSFHDVGKFERWIEIAMRRWADAKSAKYDWL